MHNSQKGKKQKNKRSFKQLTLHDRITIELRYRDGYSFRAIAVELGHERTASSVCREVAGKARKGRNKYQAHVAHEKALDKRYGKKGFRLKSVLIQTYVVEKMKLGWSPEQISLRLPIDHNRESISHEAIYQYVYAGIRRGGSSGPRKECEDLRRYLPRRHTRRAKKGFRKAQKLEKLSTLPSIEKRPKEVLARKVVGHWEDDCIVSRQSKERVKSINERVSGVVLLGKMKDGTQEESSRVVCEKLQSIPSPYVKTLTRDRGTENMGWKKIQEELNVDVYFAHAYASYERGSNENLNGLVRRFFPKKTDFSKVTDAELLQVEYLLNTRPRKRFGGKTPLEVLYELTGVAITY